MADVDRRRWYDALSAEERDVAGLAGLVLTGAGQLITAGSSLHGVFVLVAATSWLAFLGWRVLKEPGCLDAWGIRKEGLGRAARVVLPFAVLAVATCAVIGAIRGTLSFPLHALCLLLLYPVWGLIQQLIVQGLLVRTLLTWPWWRRHPLITVFAGAAGFGLVHAPMWWLVGATFLLGLIYVPVFLLSRNLWLLGIAHGWLATFFYLWVLGKDPWLQMVRQIQRSLG